VIFPISAGHHTPGQYPSHPIRLQPGDRVVARTRCWRGDCRDRFGDYLTVSHLRSRHIVAICHRRRYGSLSLEAQRHGRAAA
jgi:hypothetical protein